MKSAYLARKKNLSFYRQLNVSHLFFWSSLRQDNGEDKDEVFLPSQESSHSRSLAECTDSTPLEHMVGGECIVSDTVSVVPDLPVEETSGLPDSPMLKSGLSFNDNSFSTREKSDSREDRFCAIKENPYSILGELLT